MTELVRRLVEKQGELSMHIDDWLDTPAVNETEKTAKVFLEHCRRPAIDKDYEWIESNPLFCLYQGACWRVVGASRLGDVWLTKQFERANGYDLRVDVSHCSTWAKTPNVRAKLAPERRSCFPMCRSA